MTWTGFTARFSSNVTAGLSPLAVEFNATVSGGTGPFTFDWTFGDGFVCQHCSGSLVKHTYRAAGNMTAGLTVTNSTGASYYAEQKIVVVLPRKVPESCVSADLGTLSGSLAGYLPVPSGGAQTIVSANVSAALHPVFSLCLRATKGDFVRFEADMRLDSNVSIDVSASSSYTYPGGNTPVPLGSPIYGAPIYIPGTPIVFLPIVQPVLIVNASFGGSVSVFADSNSSVNFGEVWTPIGWVPDLASVQCLNGGTPLRLCFLPARPSTTVSASINAEVGIEVTLALYGIAGPELTFGPFLGFSAAASTSAGAGTCGGISLGGSSSPWYAICSGFDVSAGASMSLFGYGAKSYKAAELVAGSRLIVSSVALSRTSSKSAPMTVSAGGSLSLAGIVAGDAILPPHVGLMWKLSGSNCGNLSSSTGGSVTYYATQVPGGICKLAATIIGTPQSLVLPSLGMDQAIGWIRTV